MKFSVKKIQANREHGPIQFNDRVDLSSLEALDNNDIKQIGDVAVHGTCFVENEEIVIDFVIEGEMILPCARTLVEVSYPFRFHVTEIFTTNIHEADEEEEIHFVEEEIDLLPFIKEAVLLQMPYRVFSKDAEIEDGDGWSFFTEDAYEEAQKQEIDPRLAKLKKFLDDRQS